MRAGNGRQASPEFGLVHAEEPRLPMVREVPEGQRCRESLPGVEAVHIERNAGRSTRRSRVVLQAQQPVPSGDAELNDADPGHSEALGEARRVPDRIGVVRSVHGAQADAELKAAQLPASDPVHARSAQRTVVESPTYGGSLQSGEPQPCHSAPRIQ